jgi:hypothetical protein
VRVDTPGQCRLGLVITCDQNQREDVVRSRAPNAGADRAQSQPASQSAADATERRAGPGVHRSYESAGPRCKRCAPGATGQFDAVVDEPA